MEKFPSLVSAEELSAALRDDHNMAFSPERLLELARLEDLPHVVVDDRDVRFRWPDALRFIVRRKLRNVPAAGDPGEFFGGTAGAGGLFGSGLPRPLEWLGGSLTEFPVGIFSPTARVYFLVEGGEVVYVGTTTDVVRRLGTHARRVAFDRAFFLTVPAEEALSVERGFIRMFRPRLNSPNNPGPCDDVLSRFAPAGGRGSDAATA